MNCPANFNDLPVEEKTKIIQEEISKIEEGKTHNANTVKRKRNWRLEIHNLLNPDVASLSYSQSYAMWVSMKAMGVSMGEARAVIQAMWVVMEALHIVVMLAVMWLSTPVQV